ncbi:hypothetical protein GCWU000246_01108 [Jonquetella anthropi E3_33 E1]|nr:hypothetical protein GCWU000246_01108 [Jonquetella anthropi E3_33 E1]
MRRFEKPPFFPLASALHRTSARRSAFYTLELMVWVLAASTYKIIV